MRNRLVSRWGKSLCAIAMVLGITMVAGCGDDNDRTFFIGDISNSSGAPLPRSATLREGNETEIDLSGIIICALDECDTTDANGGFGFNVARSQLQGDGIAFIFKGRGIDTSTVVNDLPPGQEIITISFTVLPDRTVQVVAVDSGDGGFVPPPVIQPTVEPTAEPLPTDPPDTTPTIEPTPTFGEPEILPTPTIVSTGACDFLAGTYTGNGGCQLNSVTASGSGSLVTLSPFGSNSSAGFAVDGNFADSTSTDLVLFGQSGHSCEIHCLDESSFSITCSNPGGGRCTESFNK